MADLGVSAFSTVITGLVSCAGILKCDHNKIVSVEGCFTADLGMTKFSTTITGLVRYYKVRPSISDLAAVFSMYYRKWCQLSIDEMMISTRWLFSFIQYIYQNLPTAVSKYG